jgi:flagellin-specific chaperone FliS
MNLDNKLAQIEPKVTDPHFRDNLGSANEVGYYVFDYEPKEELKVRDYVKKLTEEINQKEFLDINIKYFDLYDVMIEFLKEEDILEDVFILEEDEGYEEVIHSIRDAMGIDTINDNFIIQYIKDKIDDNSIVFLTGLGKVFPIIRAHKILNNLHLVLDKVPVILFLPGEFSGLEIKLFGLLNNNYYRAFKLIK